MLASISVIKCCADILFLYLCNEFLICKSLKLHAHCNHPNRRCYSLVVFEISIMLCFWRESLLAATCRKWGTTVVMILFGGRFKQQLYEGEILITFWNFCTWHDLDADWMQILYCPWTVQYFMYMQNASTELSKHTDKSVLVHLCNVDQW